MAYSPGSSHPSREVRACRPRRRTIAFEAVDSWEELRRTLAAAAGPNDLVTVVVARRGDVGWHDELADLPQRLTELPPESFVLFHSCRDDPEYDRLFLRFE